MPLFKISEVFFRDSAGTSDDHYLSLEPRGTSSSFQDSCTASDKESSTDNTIIECLCPEELELAQQMDALGLPLSFGTSKPRNNVISSKRNGRKTKFPSQKIERNIPVPQILVFRHDEDLLNKHELDRCSDDSSTSCCNMNLKWDTQTLHSSISGESPLRSLADHHDNFVCCELMNWRVIWDPFYGNNYFFNVQTLESTWHPPLGFENYTFTGNNLSRKETLEGAAEKYEETKQFCCSISLVTDSTLENGGGFHFIDEQTNSEQPVKISTKLEAGIDFASHYTTNGNETSNVQLSLYPSYATDDDIKDEENECKDLDEQKKKQQADMIGSYYGHDCTMPTTISENENTFSFPATCMTSSVCLDIAHENVAINKKKRERKSQSLNVQFRRCLADHLFKYWHQRYSLFSRFDNGIKMDEESWFSVTPEEIAKHHAFRCGAGTIIDCFSGAGGNAIQFAMRSNCVIAIDVDPQKIDYARHNATIYGVRERIDFIKCDFFKLAPLLKGDIAFLSPPWGGPDYAKKQTYDISSLKPREGRYLFKIASKIAPKVIMFLPRNVNIDQLVELSLSVDPPWNLEVEKNYLNGKLKSITAYFDRTIN